MYTYSLALIYHNPIALLPAGPIMGVTRKVDIGLQGRHSYHKRFQLLLKSQSSLNSVCGE